MKVRMERQWAILTVSGQMFTEICKRGMRNFGVIQNALPADAEFKYAYPAPIPYNGVIHLVLESGQFKKIKEGEPLPVLPDPVFSHQRIGWLRQQKMRFLYLLESRKRKSAQKISKQDDGSYGAR